MQGYQILITTSPVSRLVARLSREATGSAGGGGVGAGGGFQQQGGSGGHPRKRLKINMQILHSVCFLIETCHLIKYKVFLL